MVEQVKGTRVRNGRVNTGTMYQLTVVRLQILTRQLPRTGDTGCNPVPV